MPARPPSFFSSSGLPFPPGNFRERQRLGGSQLRTENRIFTALAADVSQGGTMLW